MPPTPANSLWRRLFDDLLGQIHAGRLADGDKLQTEKELCEQHNISRITVRRALRELELLGLLRRQRGAGTTVVAPRADDMPRLIRVLMYTDGHLLDRLHLGIISRLKELGFEHRVWSPGIDAIEDIIAVPARGTIVVPWNIDVRAVRKHAARLGRMVAIVADAGSNHQLPGCGVDFHNPLYNALMRARNHDIHSVIHLTYRDHSDHRTAIAGILMTECVEARMKLSVLSVFDSGADAEMAELQAALKTVAKPTIVVCASDFIAARALAAVRAIGMSVPGEVSILGLFDTPWSQDNDISSIGPRLADQIDSALALILTNRSDQTYSLLPGELIVRGTGPGSPGVAQGAD